MRRTYLAAAMLGTALVVGLAAPAQAAAGTGTASVVPDPDGDGNMIVVKAARGTANRIVVTSGSTYYYLTVDDRHPIKAGRGCKPVKGDRTKVTCGLGELTEMAQSLKDFSRLDRAPIASFDVNAGLDKTLLIAKNIVKHKATVSKFYGEIPEIECSPSQINQVFLNIVTNAAQAIETQGEIVITTKLYDPDHVAIRISDTGCGIPEENLSKIRDPFFTTKEVGTGTGLGLSIVDEIVRSHFGELQVESVVGKASTFTVILPIKRPAAHVERLLGESDELPPLKEAV